MSEHAPHDHGDDSGDQGRPPRSAEYQKTAAFITTQLRNLVDMVYRRGWEDPGDQANREDDWKPVLNNPNSQTMIIRTNLSQRRTEQVEDWGDEDDWGKQAPVVTYVNKTNTSIEDGFRTSYESIEVTRGGEIRRVKALLDREQAIKGLYPETQPVSDDRTTLMSLQATIYNVTDAPSGEAAH